MYIRYCSNVWQNKYMVLLGIGTYDKQNVFKIYFLSYVRKNVVYSNDCSFYFWNRLTIWSIKAAWSESLAITLSYSVQYKPIILESSRHHKILCRFLMKCGIVSSAQMVLEAYYSQVNQGLRRYENVLITQR